MEQDKNQIHQLLPFQGPHQTLHQTLFVLAETPEFLGLTPQEEVGKLMEHVDPVAELKYCM